MTQIVVGLEYTSISLQALTNRLQDSFGEAAEAVQTETSFEKPEDFTTGCNLARDLAFALWRDRGAPLCIGVIRVPYDLQCPGMKPADLDIAMVFKYGALPQRMEKLNPTSHKRAAIGQHVRETAYAHEGLLSLLELIRVHHRAILLGQTL